MNVDASQCVGGCVCVCVVIWLACGANVWPNLECALNCRCRHKQGIADTNRNTHGIRADRFTITYIIILLVGYVWMHAATRCCGYPADSSDLAEGAAGVYPFTSQAQAGSLPAARAQPGHGRRIG